MSDREAQALEEMRKAKWRFDKVPTTEGDTWEITPAKHIYGCGNLVATVYEEETAKLIVNQHNLLLPSEGPKVL